MCSKYVLATLLALFAHSMCIQELSLPPEGSPPTAELLDMQATRPKKAKNAISEDIMYNYLMQFDYLPKSDLETGALRTEDQLKDAIRSLQSFGNITVTGEIDSATARLIQKRRCGVGDRRSADSFSPDNLYHESGSNVRVRRFALQGPKWPKMDLTWSCGRTEFEPSNPRLGGLGFRGTEPIENPFANRPLTQPQQQQLAGANEQLQLTIFGCLCSSVVSKPSKRDDAAIEATKAIAFCHFCDLTPKVAQQNFISSSQNVERNYRSHIYIAMRIAYLWRIGTSGLYPGYPTETRRHWSALPENLTKVDAVYENKQRQIVFFIGREYYVFNSVTLAPGFPKPLASLGLPPTLTHIDASFVWGHNNRTYMTSGTLYWRIDDYTGQVELDYPRDMSIWSGVGYNIDAAFQYSDGKTYFFKNLGYWEFNDDRMKVAHARAKLSARKWMQCARSANEVDDEQRWTASLVSGENEGEETGRSGSRELRINHFLLPILLLAIATWRS
ncbi:GD10058 [Drosophila simulans]|uniref:GD10058 n=1 Tax=Drosophila simulans TaxID=7240 RepID=B4QHP4_DROSI|nr:GD10058 [Drosophila simulans]